MQSYNLMKMSSEVTKTQVTPTLKDQERVNNYYSQSQVHSHIQQPQIQPHLQQPQVQPQTQPYFQQQVDYNQQMFGSPMHGLNEPQLNDTNSDSNFLGKNLKISF